MTAGARQAGLRSGSLPQTQELPTTDAVQEFSRVVESKDTCDIEEVTLSEADLSSSSPSPPRKCDSADKKLKVPSLKHAIRRLQESFHDAGDVETEQTKSSLREMREMGKMWEREDCDASLDAVKLAITTNIATIFSPRGSALPEPDEFHDSLPSMSPGGPAQCRVEEPAGDPQPAAVLPDPSAAVSVAIVADGREAFRDGGSERVEKAGSPPGYPPGISEATAILEPRAVAAQVPRLPLGLALQTSEDIRPAGLEDGAVDVASGLSARIHEVERLLSSLREGGALELSPRPTRHGAVTPRRGGGLTTPRSEGGLTTPRREGGRTAAPGNGIPKNVPPRPPSHTQASPGRPPLAALQVSASMPRLPIGIGAAPAKGPTAGADSSAWVREPSSRVPFSPRRERTPREGSPREGSPREGSAQTPRTPRGESAISPRERRPSSPIRPQGATHGPPGACIPAEGVDLQRQQGGAHTPGTRDAEATSSRCLSPAPAERACGGPSPELAATPSLPHLIAEASPVADAGSAGKAGPGTSAVTSSGDKCKPEPAHDHGLPASQSHVLDRDISAERGDCFPKPQVSVPSLQPAFSKVLLEQEESKRAEPSDSGISPTQARAAAGAVAAAWIPQWPWTDRHGLWHPLRSASALTPSPRSGRMHKRCGRP
ncbi:hypothetical protein CYMTET_9147 [Cymbomonas tetramitiformis]|uniref:Uncharacterized protein n=1 Tax=Cymbomonas tetramitiformis TaxID=36881 RepID=A0AAE0LFS2_9CHLO|nr:hypothetical protein CYMTET_9147 [Cymbomonas tetramitiformis]